MDYKEKIEELKNMEAIAYGYNINGEVLGMDCSDFEQIMVDAAESITDLLARAEAAEQRCKELEDRCKRLDEARERANEAAAKWESVYHVALERADDIGSWRKAMEERDAAISDMETVMAYGGANVDTCQFCKNGQCYARGGEKLCLPKWRGSEEK